VPFTGSENGPGLEASSQVANYLVIEEIGRGGMAVVYHALDVGLDRRVALKILSGDVRSNRAYRERFLRESKAAAAVDHPNILPIYDAGEADGVFFIAMRYVSDRDLGSLLERVGPLPLARAVSITAQVASALDAAHARGLVHRDVKPANILLGDVAESDSGDHVYLSDFGISLLAGAPVVQARGGRSGAAGVPGLTVTDECVGTVNYAAPEQLLDADVDGRADAYSLACVFFEMLSGRPPFTGEYDESGQLGQFSASPPALTRLRPDLPSAVDAVLAKALSVNPGHRYSNCRALAAALAEACGLGASEPTAKTRRPVLNRRRLLAASAVCVAALAAVSGAWALQHKTAAPGPAKTLRVISPTASAVPGPAATVESYVSDINHLDYSAAWSLWGIRTGTTYQRFVSGYATTARESLRNLSVSGDVVAADLTVLRTNGAENHFHGRFTVRHGVIVAMSLTPYATASPVPTHAAAPTASAAPSKPAADCSKTASADISADCYTSSNGAITVTVTDDPSPAGVDGNQLPELSNGDYLEYPDVNFGSGADHFTARVACGAPHGDSGGVEVVLDNPANKPVAGFSLGNTGGWDSWENVGTNMTEVTGIHNVYIVLASGGPAPYMSLHYFTFGSS
jgi:serine/threonine protein kinase